jgi:hypothetical protein
MAETKMVMIINASTGEVVEREANAKELAEMKNLSLNSTEKPDIEQKIAARESALTKLAALGLTEEEVGAL